MGGLLPFRVPVLAPLGQRLHRKLHLAGWKLLWDLSLTAILSIGSWMMAVMLRVLLNTCQPAKMSGQTGVM